MQEVRVFVAPKIFGGTALSPVGGYGVAHPDEAVGMELISYEPIDADMYLRYRVTYNRV